MYYEELEKEDLSNAFLAEIEKRFDYKIEPRIEKKDFEGMEIVRKISTHYGIENINFIKPGIGEATRGLLRRIPWKIIVHKDYISSPEIAHLLQLAKEKEVEVEICPFSLGNYKVCGIIKQFSDV